MKNINSLTHTYDTRVRIFWILISISVISLVLYIYAVLATVQHTVAREGLLGQSQTLTASVSELEYRDIAIKNTLNLDSALARGFTEVVKPMYISRTSAVLTLNTFSR